MPIALLLFDPGKGNEEKVPSFSLVSSSGRVSGRAGSCDSKIAKFLLSSRGG